MGRFPPGWAERNGRYRDTVRRYWRGEPGQVGELAYRLAGSSDLFQEDGRRPSASVNFVTCHDGFTLADLVADGRKHNEANGEANRDGTDENLSWNCGVEGPTDDPVVLALREQQMRNVLATLFLSQGIPMLMAGDEMGRSQGGNNNAYCQDNATSWLDWELDDRSRRLHHFTRSLIRLRRHHPEFEHSSFFRGERAADVKDIVWLTPDGAEMSTADWRDPEVRALAIRLSGQEMEEVDAQGAPLTDDTFLILLNAGPDPVHFVLPDCHPGEGWEPVVDTAVAPAGLLPLLEAGGTVSVVGRALLLLRARPSGQ
jgi:glycogen operon protein